MGYSARRGFTSGNMKATGALRQAGDAMDKAMDSITGGLNLGGLGL